MEQKNQPVQKHGTLGQQEEQKPNWLLVGNESEPEEGKAKVQTQDFWAHLL